MILYGVSTLCLLTIYYAKKLLRRNNDSIHLQVIPNVGTHLKLRPLPLWKLSVLDDTHWQLNKNQSQHYGRSDACMSYLYHKNSSISLDIGHGVLERISRESRLKANVSFKRNEDWDVRNPRDERRNRCVLWYHRCPTLRSFQVSCVPVQICMYEPFLFSFLVRYR